MSDRRGFLQKFGALIGIGVASKLPDVVGDGTGFYEVPKTVIPNTNLAIPNHICNVTGDFGHGFGIFNIPCSGELLLSQDIKRFIEDEAQKWTP